MQYFCREVVKGNQGSIGCDQEETCNGGVDVEAELQTICNSNSLTSARSGCAEMML